MRFLKFLSKMAFFALLSSFAMLYAGEIDGLWQTNSESDWETRLELLKNGKGSIHWRQINPDDGNAICSTAALKWKKAGDSLQVSTSTESCTFKIGQTYDLADTALMTLLPVGSSDANTELFDRFYKFGNLTSFIDKWKSFSCTKQMKQ